MKAAQPLGVRLHRTVRDGSADVRSLYVAARKTGAFLRDRPRRAILRGLPPPVHAISRDAGFLIVSADALPSVGLVVAEAQAALSHFDQHRPPDGKNKKRFLVNVLYRDTLTRDSEIVKFALRPDVLRTVSDYLGMAPLLTSIAVFHSDTVDGVPTSSQLYHCDGDDVAQVKIFIYCSDVDARSGPLTIVEAAATRVVQARTRYKYGQRLSDEQVRGAFNGVREHAILGRAGTAVFLDTSRCLHYGSRVAAGAPPRLVTMIQYSTPYSFMVPWRYRGSLPYTRLSDPSDSPLQRLVLGVD